MGGEIPLVKVDSFCAVDIHERERHYDRMFFFSHLTSNSTQIMTIHEISKMQLLNYLKYLFFFVLLQLLQLFMILVKINNQ